MSGLDLRIVPTAEAAAEVTADSIARRLRAVVRLRSEAHIAFSGGGTTPPMLEQLVAMDVPWRVVHAYQVDERVAPDGDPDRNANQLAVLPLPARRLHLMPVTARNLDTAARRYAARLPERFDIVHLGIGDDGHTASWPPGDPIIDAAEPVAVSGEFNGRVRMTLTPPVVNAARVRLFEVTGAAKAGVVRDWINRHRSSRKPALPVAVVRRTDTVVVLDAAAAARLTGPLASFTQ